MTIAEYRSIASKAVSDANKLQGRQWWLAMQKIPAPPTRCVEYCGAADEIVAMIDGVDQERKPRLKAKEHACPWCGSAPCRGLGMHCAGGESPIPDFRRQYGRD